LTFCVHCALFSSAIDDSENSPSAVFER